MKYFIDTEFTEGTQAKKFLWFEYGRTKPTIDLISIGIVAEDGREYYAISKDFNLDEAWNRYQMKQVSGDMRNQFPHGVKEYWIRDNVLKPIFDDFYPPNLGNLHHYPDFDYSNMKTVIANIGKSNSQIAEEIKSIFSINRVPHEGTYPNTYPKDVQFYAYYADYDWVVFCQLFGTMNDLPKGFPMFSFDIQQQIEEYKIDKEQLLKDVPQVNCHNSLQDAIWNKNAHNWIQNKINNGK